MNEMAFWAETLVIWSPSQYSSVWEQLVTRHASNLYFISCHIRYNVWIGACAEAKGARAERVNILVNWGSSFRLFSVMFQTSRRRTRRHCRHHHHHHHHHHYHHQLMTYETFLSGFRDLSLSGNAIVISSWYFISCLFCYFIAISSLLMI